MSESETRRSTRWWIPIGVLAAVIPVMLVLGILLPPDAYSILVIAPFMIVGLAATLISPVAIYFDRRYVASVSDWTPSDWYYFIIAQPLTLVLPYLYLYRRHRHIGKP